MLKSTDLDRCVLCGRPAESLDPLVPEEFYPGVQLHLHCLNSAAGRAWTQGRAAADPLYARYLSLITLGHEVHCSGCGSLERLSPKSSGMGAGHWEVSCRSCHRYRPLLSGYRSPREHDLCSALGRLAQEFKLGRSPAAVLMEVDHLSQDADPLLASESCTCGGAFSVVARPRCSRCQDMLIDSPFHFTLNAAPSPRPETMSTRRTDT